MATKPVPTAALINLTKSIALAESGKDGAPDYNAVGDNGTSKGAYQFNGDNFENWASQYGYDPTDFSPENQNKVALAHVTDLYNQGLSPSQIAAAWNAGEDKAKDGSWQTNIGTTTIDGKEIPYDTPAYVNKVNSIYGKLAGGQDASADTSTPTPPPTSGNWLTNSIKGVADGTGDDFKNLAKLPSTILHPSDPNYWGVIGGSVNALSDVALAGGILAGDIATGGADTPADPAEMAGGMAARDVAEKGVVAGVKKVAQSTVGRFAAGKGVGLAAQGAVSAASSGAQALQKGATKTQAAVSAAASAATTVATFGLMNWLGPKVSNGFVNLVAKTKFGDAVKNSLSTAADYIKSSAAMGSLKTAGEGVVTKLNAAAEQVVAASSKALGGIASSLKTPTVSETGAMVQRASANVSETGNKVVESTFQKALTALSKFTISKDDVADIAKQLAGNIGGKVSSMAEALAGDTDATVSQRSQMLMLSLANGGKETVDKIINGLNIKTPEAVDATLTSGWWKAIKDVVGKTPEGQAALQQYTDAMTARAQQNEQATFTDTMRHAMAGGWERMTSSVFSMLKDGGSVQNLQKALGDDFPAFQKNLTQKIIADATRAYQGVVTTAGGNITPKVADEAQKSLASTVDDYLEKLNKLPGILSSKTLGFLGDMKNGIPTVSSLADNLGIDGSKIVDEKGNALLEQGAQTSQKATQETIDTVRNSAVGKAIASKNYSELPQALLSSSKEEIAATKQLLGENSQEWKTITAGALGNIMQKVTGLFGTTTKDSAESFLENISAGLSGDKEKYSLLFDTAGGKAKDSSKALIDNITDLANAIKSGSKPKALAKAGGAILAYSIHHVYMAAMMARDSANEFMSADDSALLKQLASKSPAQLRAEFNKGAIDSSNWIVRGIDLINRRVIGPLLKYEVSQKLGQAVGGSVDTAGEDQGAL